MAPSSSKLAAAKAKGKAAAKASKRKAEDVDDAEEPDWKLSNKAVSKMRALLIYRSSDKCKKAWGLHQVNALIQSMLRKRGNSPSPDALALCMYAGDSPSPGALAGFVPTQETHHLLVHSQYLFLRRRLTISWCMLHAGGRPHQETSIRSSQSHMYLSCLCHAGDRRRKSGVFKGVEQV